MYVKLILMCDHITVVVV